MRGNQGGASNRGTGAWPIAAAGTRPVTGASAHPASRASAPKACQQPHLHPQPQSHPQLRPHPQSQPQPQPQPGDTVGLILLVLSFVLLNAAQWLTRAVAPSAVLDAAFIARILVVLLLFGLMALARYRAVRLRGVALTSLVAFAVAVPLFLVGLLVPLGTEESLVLDYMQRVVSSVGYVACIVAIIVSFARCPDVNIPVVIGTWLATQVLFFALSYAPAAVIEVVRPLMRLGASLLLCVHLYRRGVLAPVFGSARPALSRCGDGSLANAVSPTVLGAAVPAPTASASGADPVAGAVSGASPTLSLPALVPEMRRRGSCEWTLLMVGTAVFPCLFCVVSQYLGDGGFEASLYDPACEIGAIGFLACLLAGKPLMQGRLSAGPVLVLCLALYATGFLLLPSGLGVGTLLARMAIKFGFVAFQVFSFVLLIDRLRTDREPEHDLVQAALFWGVFQASKVLGRGLSLYALASSGHAVDGTGVWSLAVGGVYAVALCAVVLFAIQYHRGAHRVVAAVGAEAGAGTATGGEADADAATPAVADALAAWASGATRDPARLGHPEYPGQPGCSGRPVADARVVRFGARYGLSSREMDVMAWVVRGFGVREIAERLALSQGTVKTHLHNMYRKCGADDRQQLLRMFERLGEEGAAPTSAPAPGPATPASVSSST